MPVLTAWGISLLSNDPVPFAIHYKYFGRARREGVQLYKCQIALFTDANVIRVLDGGGVNIRIILFRATNFSKSEFRRTEHEYTTPPFQLALPFHSYLMDGSFCSFVGLSNS